MHLGESGGGAGAGGGEAELARVEGMQPREQRPELAAEQGALVGLEAAGWGAGQPFHHDERTSVDAERERLRHGEAAAGERP